MGTIYLFTPEPAIADRFSYMFEKAVSKVQYKDVRIAA